MAQSRDILFFDKSLLTVALVVVVAVTTVGVVLLLGKEGLGMLAVSLLWEATQR